MEYILGYCVLSGSNYRVQNINNIYNLLIKILLILNETQRKDIITEIKLIVGVTFHTDFKNYMIKKLGVDDELVKSCG